MKIKLAIDEAKKKNIKPYDDNGRVNGGEWKKAINIINKNIPRKSNEGRKAWESAFNKIISPKGQVVQELTYKDGGSRERTLKDKTRVFLDNRIGSAENGYITVTHPDKSKEKFKPDGTKA